MFPQSDTRNRSPQGRFSDRGGADLTTLGGIVLAVVSLLIMMTMEGSSPMSIVLPAPLILIFGGTLGAAIAGLTMSDVKKVGSWFKMAVLPQAVPPIGERIDLLVSLSERARKDGVLALEEEAKKIADPFLQRGLQLCADGTDSEDLRDVLDSEIESKRAEDKIIQRFFADMGGYAPTIGIIGTVVGLIHVLENLSEPEKLGHLIAGAFCATLWGVLSANFFWLPMGRKVGRTSELAIRQMEICVEGIAEIQAQTGPRAVRQKLNALLPPSEAPQENS